MSAPLPLIPESLRRGKRFVGWRSEPRAGEPKPAKVPYSANSDDKRKRSSSTAPAHWMTFDEAVSYAQVAGLVGIMRAFDHADGLVGFDLDTCLDPTIATPTVADLAPWAARIVQRLDTYTEVSPSRTGVKLWVEATMPPAGHKKGDIEIYGSVDGQTGPCGRFFTMTGHQLAGTPSEVGYRPDAVAAIHREVFGAERAPIVADVTDVDRAIPALDLGDDDVIQVADQSQHNGPRFRRLWAGDTSEYARDGNDGQSEGLAALCELVAFYGGPDEEKIERIVSRAPLALADPKWQARPDYRQRTIRFALKDKTRFYGDSARPVAPAGSDGASSCTCEACPHRAEEHRLRGLLFDRDDLVEHQQGVVSRALDVSSRQAERIRELTGYVGEIREIVGRDETVTSSDDKVALIGFVPWLHTHRALAIANGASTAFHLGYGAAVVGMHPDRFAAVLARWSGKRAESGAPWCKRVTRALVPADDGGPDGWESALDVTPWHETTVETLRACAVYTPEPPPKRGGSKHASDARWGRCTKHPHAAVDLKGYCSVGGEYLGAIRVTADMLDGLKLQNDISDQDGSATVSGGSTYLWGQNDISAPAPRAPRRRPGLKLQSGVSDAPPTPPSREPIPEPFLRDVERAAAMATTALVATRERLVIVDPLPPSDAAPEMPPELLAWPEYWAGDGAYPSVAGGSGEEDPEPPPDGDSPVPAWARA